MKRPAGVAKDLNDFLMESAAYLELSPPSDAVTDAYPVSRASAGAPMISHGRYSGADAQQGQRRA